MICRVRQYSAFRQRLFCENTRAPQGAMRILTPTPSWRAYGWGEWGSYPQMILLRRRDRILISSAGASRQGSYHEDGMILMYIYVLLSRH